MELLPCPFCGSKDIKIKNMAFSVKLFMIRCSYCNIVKGYFYKKQYAIEEWNTRHSPWISVKDRLPEIETNILINCKSYICIGYLDEENDFIFDGEIVKFTTHWMPLPQQPKET